MDKTALFNLSYGVYVVTTWAKGKATGCTANSAMQITSSPATVAVSINHDNYTNKCIKDTGIFAVNILGENVDPVIIGSFGFRSGKDVDKFEGITEAEKLEIMSAEVKNNASKMRQTINKISSQNAYIDLIEFCGVSKLKNFK